MRRALDLDLVGGELALLGLEEFEAVLDARQGMEAADAPGYDGGRSAPGSARRSTA